MNYEFLDRCQLISLFAYLDVILCRGFQIYFLYFKNFQLAM